MTCIGSRRLLSKSYSVDEMRRRLRNLFHKRRDATVPPGPPTTAPSTPALPDDIIYDIFAAAALVDPPRALDLPPDLQPEHTHTLLGWIVLTHVCRRWRTIGLSASLAHLWARVVCLSCRRDARDELLARARGCALTIDLRRYSDGVKPIVSPLWPQEYWALGEMRRADVLVVSGSRIMEWLNRDRRALPNLRELLLDLQPGDTAVPLEWEAPTLRYATLSMVLLPAHLAAGLRELHLHIDATRVPLADLRWFLRSCVLLEILDVDVKNSWRYEREYRPDVEIRLDHLERATLAVPSDQALLDIWKPIVAPASLAFNLTITSRALDPACIPRARILVDAVESQMDNVAYDRLEMFALDSCGEYSRWMRLRLYSLETAASCEMLFRVSVKTRAELLDQLPYYIPYAAARIESLTAEALVADTMRIDISPSDTH